MVRDWKFFGMKPHRFMIPAEAESLDPGGSRLCLNYMTKRPFLGRLSPLPFMVINSNYKQPRPPPIHKLAVDIFHSTTIPSSISNPLS